MENTFIYTLSCPTSKEVKYVGKSDNPEKRMLYHLLDLSDNKRTKWIKKLLSDGEKPIMNIIDEVPKNKYEFWERHYISLYKSWGFTLVNSTMGGERIVVSKRLIRKNNIIKHRILGVRLEAEEWAYIDEQKKKGISYNSAIRFLIREKIKIEIPF